MMTIYCGVNTVGFFGADDPDLPGDAKVISAELRKTLLDGQAVGKQIDFSVFPPVLVERNIIHDELASANYKKSTLIEKANDYINSKQWPGKAAIGRLKGDDLAQYNLWLDYLDALEAVDTSSAPDINWPESPEA